jgi:hypothetical protein
LSRSKNRTATNLNHFAKRPYSDALKNIRVEKIGNRLFSFPLAAKSFQTNGNADEQSTDPNSRVGLPH